MVWFWFKRIFSVAIRLVCYPVLLLVMAGFGAMIALSFLGVCPRFDTGQISCTTPAYRAWANFSMIVTLFTIFGGLGIPAIGGIYLLVRDIRSVWRRRRGTA